MHRGNPESTEAQSTAGAMRTALRSAWAWAPPCPAWDSATALLPNDALSFSTQLTTATLACQPSFLANQMQPHADQAKPLCKETKYLKCLLHTININHCYSKLTMRCEKEVLFSSPTLGNSSECPSNCSFQSGSVMGGKEKRTKN